MAWGCVHKARHRNWHRAGIQAHWFPFNFFQRDCGKPGSRGLGQGQGHSVRQKRGHWSSAPCPSVPSCPPTVTQPGPAGCAPHGCFHPPISAPQPRLPRGTLSLLTLALMGPTCFQNERMASTAGPTASPRGRGVSLGMEGSPEIGDGGVPFQRALDAFAPKSRGGRGGAVVQRCSCQSRKGVGLGLDGIQNRQVAMATFPDTPK